MALSGRVRRGRANAAGADPTRIARAACAPAGRPARRALAGALAAALCFAFAVGPAEAQPAGDGASADAPAQPKASKPKSKTKTKPKTRQKKASKAASKAPASRVRTPPQRPRRKGCPAGMIAIQGEFCIDRYEAATVELLPHGKTRAHSPYEPVTGLAVKAVSAKGKVPQAYIGRNEAEQACSRAGKRLCRDDEWLRVCRGKKQRQYPYGDEWQAGRCNDHGRSLFNELHGQGGEPPPQAAYDWENLNDPRLNQAPGTLAASGKFAQCKSSLGAFDMVGNLHEWTAAAHPTFRGGYYLDVHQNGDGCEYRTTAHNAQYHDYSTGFRCCL